MQIELHTSYEIKQHGIISNVTKAYSQTYLSFKKNSKLFINIFLFMLRTLFCYYNYYPG